MSSSRFISMGRRGLALAVSSLVLSAGAVSHAQVQVSGQKPDVIEITIDVAEDLAGKFVPTFVKPEHTQPERGAFYITQGRLFPGGTIEWFGISVAAFAVHGVDRQRGRRGRRPAHAGGHRRGRQLHRLHRRAADDIPRVQPDGRREPARDVRASQDRALNTPRHSVHSVGVSGS